MNDDSYFILSSRSDFRIRYSHVRILVLLFKNVLFAFQKANIYNVLLI